MFNRDRAALYPTAGQVVCMSAFFQKLVVVVNILFHASTALLLGHNLFLFCKPCMNTMAEVGHLRKIIVKLEQKKMQTQKKCKPDSLKMQNTIIFYFHLQVSVGTHAFFSTTFNPQTFAFRELSSLKKSSRHYAMQHIYNYNEQKEAELSYPKIKVIRGIRNTQENTQQEALCQTALDHFFWDRV